MATIDARLQRLEDRMDEVVELLNGGPTVEWERSVRGRLHRLTGDASTAKAAADALAAIRATEDRSLSRISDRAVILFGVVQIVGTVSTFAFLVFHG